jgi:pyruvate formate lyase activating enzyme
MKEAMFYEKLKDGNVQCRLCAWNCKIPEGKTGYCRVRRNSNGKLYSMVYGKAVSVAIDPIEKKPLFHFAPGSKSLSIATVGCNFRCRFCQNWEISQEYGEIFGEDLTPGKIVEMAKDYNVPGIAYTYTEPTIFFEYAYDTMKLAKKEGLYNIWVSNGYTSPEVIKFMAKYLDAVNVDMKGNDEFYRKVCLTKGIQPVYDALKAYVKNGVWVEITNLIIPGYNDSDKDIKEMAKWILDNLGPDIPLHLSAFFPQYKLTNISQTPAKTLEKAADLVRKSGIHWVYVGNVYSHKGESTCCWKCGELLIKRIGFNILSFKTKCPKCGEKVPIKGEKWKGV